MRNLTLDRPTAPTTSVRRVHAAVGSYTGTASARSSYTGTGSVVGSYTGTATSALGSYVRSER